MGLSTNNIGQQFDKRAKIKEMEKFHIALFNKERKNNPKFLARVPYMYKGELVIGLFSREITTTDIYIEFSDSGFNPISEQRTLWKWIFNPNYRTDYALGTPNPVTQDQVFLIPITDLINVSRYHDPDRAPEVLPTNVKDITPKEEPKPESVVETPKKDEEEFFNETEIAGVDVPLEAVTLRDLAAIFWRKPVSGKPWFNELIKQTFK